MLLSLIYNLKLFSVLFWGCILSSLAESGSPEGWNWLRCPLCVFFLFWLWMGFAPGLVGSVMEGLKHCWTPYGRGSCGSLGGKRSPSWLSGTPGKFDKAVILFLKLKSSYLAKPTGLMFALKYHEGEDNFKDAFQNYCLFLQQWMEMWLLQIPIAGFLAINDSQCMHILWKDVYTQSSHFYNCTNSACR